MKQFVLYILFISIVIAGSAYLYFDTNISSKKSLNDEANKIEKVIDNEKKSPNYSPSAEKSNKTSSDVSFDIVRVTKEGSAVIAGRAPSGSKVTVYDNNIVIGSVVADPQGEWVLIPEQPFSSGSRELIAEAELDNGMIVRSNDVVVLSVPDTSKSSSEPIAVLSNRKNLKASKVLQKKNANNMTDRSKSVFIDIIDYNEKGKVIVSGRTSPNSKVKIYADGTLVGIAISDESGIWASILDELMKPGNYILRVDKIDSNETVVARASIPFTRAKSSDLIFEEGNVIIQPGNSLWRIARATYGSGFQYTIIYDANKSQINDPNLIYPGQVFKLPKSSKENKKQ